MFTFVQKVEKLFGDKENQNIHRNQDISGAFSSLSHYIWDYLQNQFNFSQTNASQESSLSFQDVAEKVNSQKFFAELHDNPDFDELLTYFNGLMSEENPQDFNEELRKHVQELISCDVIDEETARELFGDGVDWQNEGTKEDQMSVVEISPAEEELKNQYLTISQDLAHISNNNMEEETKQSKMTHQSNSKKFPFIEIQKNEPQEMSEEVRAGGSNMTLSGESIIAENQKIALEGISVGLNHATQVTTQTSMVPFSETSEMRAFQQQLMDFDMPFEFDEVSEFMAAFPFTEFDSFGFTGWNNNEEMEDKEK
jgi:mannitol/fructose-specific phosphotransferase system IIA component (Ntr-type)